MVADDLWVAVKFQSSLEIAGSLRNSFRASVFNKFTGGRSLNVLGVAKITENYQNPNTSKYKRQSDYE